MLHMWAGPKALRLRPRRRNRPGARVRSLMMSRMMIPFSSAVQMGIESTRRAPVEPVISTASGAHVAVEVLGGIRRPESEIELVRVRNACEGQRHDGAEYVQVDATWLAMVGEALALFGASIAEEAGGVGGLREEGESVLLVEWVGDLLGHFEAFLVEEEVAGCAGVDHSRGFEIASRARRG